MTQSIHGAHSSVQAAPIAVALPVPRVHPHDADRHRFPDASGARPKVILLDRGVPSDALHERLQVELDVTARLSLPLEPTEIEAALAAHRPGMLLSTAPLETLDNSLMKACFEHRVRIFVLALPAYGLLGPARLHRFGGVPWLRLGWPGRYPVGASVKRAVDVLVVLAAVPLVLSIVLLISAVICWDGPPLYCQERVGEGGRTFRLVKLRTIRVGAELDTGPVFADQNDARTTRVGRMLRRLRLDELPQLWNVLRGEMSLVGPRPERPEFIVDFRCLPHYETRHLIRPGITGIAQLTGGYSATAEEKLRCDLLYVNCRSLRLDFQLLLMTVVDLVRGFPRG
jgi:lipopolysaccharide/colanic/teichoic acid biosynthesis glycosyltransferase